MLLTVGLRGTPSLCIFGSPYSLGGLEPAGCSCLHISSVRVNFLSSSVIFRSVESVGSLAGFLYDRSSRKEVICLHSTMLRITVALPLSAGRMVSSVFFFKVLSASLSALIKLSLGLEELFIILTVSCLASSTIFTGTDCTAFSNPAVLNRYNVWSHSIGKTFL